VWTASVGLFWRAGPGQYWRAPKLDKIRNADGFRGVTKPAEPALPREPAGIAPLLRKLMTEYAATGLPPAYIPKEEK
jgi:hypothetical protein